MFLAAITFLQSSLNQGLGIWIVFFGGYGYGTLGDIIEDTSEKGDRVIIVKDIIIDMDFTEVCKVIPVSVVKIPN